MAAVEEFQQLTRRESALMNDAQVSAELGLPTNRMPQTDQEVDAVERLLASEFESLSFNERETANYDLHGVLESARQDPQDFDNKLQEMDNIIRNMHPDSKKYYEKAKYLNEAFVTKLRPMFLRCDDYDVAVAAQRLVKHFEVKQVLFGDGDVLTRHLRLSDLPQEDS